MIPLVVISGFLEMLFSLKINISSKLTWIVLIPLHQLSYLVFQIKQPLLGLIPILYITDGKNLPLQMAVLLILHRQMVPRLLMPCVAPPKLLDLMRGMDLPILL